jgi:pimeloyl-ACP methyl ester carboxylesterase
MQMTLIFMLSLMAAVVLAGFLYQWLGGHRDRRLYTDKGRWVEIDGGCRLYLLEKGVGGPTVIFESGIAATNLNWHHIQEEVAQFTHTASYDRGGLGWSSCARTARTPGNIARELSGMLERAGIEPPFVMVGHSFGGLVVRRFALLYPEKVTGIVLVDPMRPEEWPPCDPSKQGQIDRGMMLSSYAVPIARCGLARLAVTSLLCRDGRISDYLAGKAGNGGAHVLSRVKGEVGKMPREVWPAVAAHWSRPAYYRGMGGHVQAIPDTVREMLDAEPIRRIPVTLLTPGSTTELGADCLARIGDNVTQVLAPESKHWVHLDDPKLVLGAIRGMVEMASAEVVAG